MENMLKSALLCKQFSKASFDSKTSGWRRSEEGASGKKLKGEINDEFALDEQNRKCFATICTLLKTHRSFDKWDETILEKCFYSLPTLARWAARQCNAFQCVRSCRNSNVKKTPKIVNNFTARMHFLSLSVSVLLCMNAVISRAHSARQMKGFNKRSHAKGKTR